MKKKTVLVVDDDPIVRAMLREFLLQADFDVELAPSATQAISQLKVMKPDLVLLDIEMPEVSGIELLRQLRNEPETKRLPVIFLTGSPLEANTTVEILELDPSDILTKIISSKELIARIHWVLRRTADFGGDNR